MVKRGFLLLLLLAVTAAAVIFYYTGPEESRKTGLYEYVRKADRYMEEGKYEKAVGLLNRAYNKLPASEGLRKELIYGYLKYARHLDLEGKTDRAIDCLLAAYGIDKSDAGVTNNLAYLYSKKAVQESEAGESGQAVEYLQKAMDLAMVSKKIRKNISNYLFNTSVKAYRKDDSRTFLLCLNASYSLWSRFETLDLFGQYYFRGSMPEKALFYWEKAAFMRPENTDMKEKVEKVRKDMILKGRMKDIETEHFNVRFYRDYSIDLRQLEKVLKKIYYEVGRDLDCFPSGNTSIIFYNEKDFREVFGQKGLVRAFYDGSIRMVLTAGTDTGSPLFAAVTAHEYTHALLSMLTDNRCPAWLGEGIAMFEQARQVPVSLTRVKNTVASGKKLSIDMLQKGFNSPDRPEETGLSYEGAYTAVSFIIDKWGWPGLLGLLERIKNQRHFANAIDEEFYISVKNFEEIWNSYLREKFM